MDKMKLIAGSGDIDRIVTSVGIADYEFLNGFGELGGEEAFKRESIVISSLLSAKDDP